MTASRVWRGTDLYHLSYLGFLRAFSLKMWTYSSTLLMLIRLKVLRGAGGIGRKNMSEYTPEEAKYILYYSLWLFIPLVAGATMMSYEHFWGG